MEAWAKEQGFDTIQVALEDAIIGRGLTKKTLAEELRLSNTSMTKLTIRYGLQELFQAVIGVTKGELIPAEDLFGGEIPDDVLCEMYRCSLSTLHNERRRRRKERWW